MFFHITCNGLHGLWDSRVVLIIQSSDVVKYRYRQLSAIFVVLVSVENGADTARYINIDNEKSNISTSHNMNAKCNLLEFECLYTFFEDSYIGNTFIDKSII